jgi:hypothetical protein
MMKIFLKMCVVKFIMSDSTDDHKYNLEIEWRPRGDYPRELAPICAACSENRHQSCIQYKGSVCSCSHEYHLRR